MTDDDNSVTMTMTMTMAMTMMPNDYYDEQPPAKPLFLRLRGQSMVCCSYSYGLKVLYVKYHFDVFFSHCMSYFMNVLY